MLKTRNNDADAPDASLRFPSIPHLAWLGEAKEPRGDKLLPAADAERILSGEVIVEEKLDGANTGISMDGDGRLRVQNRREFLTEPFGGQYSRLGSWLGQHGEGLRAALSPGLAIFGEWLAARHSVRYDRLPDWFVAFDVFDRASARFWDSARRDRLAERAGLATVPRIARGRFSLADLEALVMGEASRCGSDEPVEGVVVRSEAGEWCDMRAKLVRPGFVQAIETHWKLRKIEWNRVDWARAG